MIEALLALAVLCVLAVILLGYKTLRRPRDRKAVISPDLKLSKYNYSRKRFIMTQAENNFYRVLKTAFGDKYEIFPQVHIGTFIDHRVGRQDYRAALSVIQRKSVDYLLCTRGYCNPILAIELDDKTHANGDRAARDTLVKEIFEDAGMPLLRIKWQRQYDPMEIEKLVNSSLQDNLPLQ